MGFILGYGVGNMGSLCWESSPEIHMFWAITMSLVIGIPLLILLYHLIWN